MYVFCLSKKLKCLILREKMSKLKMFDLYIKTKYMHVIYDRKSYSNIYYCFQKYAHMTFREPNEYD